jgi:hypothetical protein
MPSDCEIEAAAKAMHYQPVYDFIDPDESQDGQEHLGWSCCQRLAEAALAAAEKVRKSSPSRTDSKEARTEESPLRWSDEARGNCDAGQHVTVTLTREDCRQVVRSIMAAGLSLKPGTHTPDAYRLRDLFQAAADAPIEDWRDEQEARTEESRERHEANTIAAFQARDYAQREEAPDSERTDAAKCRTL